MRVRAGLRGWEHLGCVLREDQLAWGSLRVQQGTGRSAGLGAPREDPKGRATGLGGVWGTTGSWVINGPGGAPRGKDSEVGRLLGEVRGA